MRSAAAILGVSAAVVLAIVLVRGSRVKDPAEPELAAGATHQAEKPRVRNLAPPPALAESAQPARVPARAARSPASSRLAFYVEQARRARVTRIQAGNDVYEFLPNLEVVEVGTGDEAETEIERLKAAGLDVLDRRSGVVFVNREDSSEPVGLPMAAYNTRTGNLAIITGTYKVVTESPGYGDSLISRFRHMSLVAEFQNLRLSLLQSRAADRLVRDLDAIRGTPGVESAELEILENEARGI